MTVRAAVCLEKDAPVRIADVTLDATVGPLGCARRLLGCSSRELR